MIILPTQAQQTRYPTGDGYNASLWTRTPLSPANSYSKVDEDIPDDTDYLFIPTVGDSITFTFPAFSVPVGAIIDSLTIFYRAKATGAAVVGMGGVVVGGSLKFVSNPAENAELTDAYADYTYNYSSNPAGGGWTVADINGTGTKPLTQFGVWLNGRGDVYLSQCYAIVHYHTDGDITTGFQSEMAKTNSSPVLIMSVPYEASTKIFADRNISIDGVPFTEGVIDEWGEPKPLNQGGLFDITIMSWPVKLANTTDISQYLTPDTLVTVSLWFEGTEASDAKEVGRFYIQKPNWNSFDGQVILVSSLYRANKPIGEKLNLTDYPGAAPKAVGKISNIIYGSNKNVPCLNTIAGGAAILKTAITNTTTSITVTVPPNAKPFPASNFTIKIQYEQIRISAYNSTTGVMTVATSGRGYNSTQAISHEAGRVIWEYLASYRWLVANHPVKSIGDAYVQGVRVATGVTKVLTPKAYIDISDSFTLDSSVNLESLSPGLVHGSNYKTMKVYGNLGKTGYLVGSIYSYAPTSTPTLGAIKQITVNIGITNNDTLSITDFSVVDDSSYMVINETGLTLYPGTNTLSFSATGISDGVAWKDILKLRLNTPSRLATLTKCEFEVVYDDTVAPDVKQAIFQGNVGTLSTAGLAVAVATDVETLGDIVGIVVVAKVDNTNTPAVDNLTCEGNTSYLVMATNPGRLNAYADGEYYFSPQSWTANQSWANILKVKLRGQPQLILTDLKFVIYYRDADYFRPQSAELDGLTSAAIEIGKRVSVDVEGYPDDGSGTYTGSANALIQNPADVAKHFITVYGGLTPDATFTTARTALAGKSYKWAIVLNNYELFVDTLRGMQFQGRVRIWDNLRGSMKMLMLPDTAPASVKDLTEDDIFLGPDKVPMLTVAPVDKADVLNKIALHYNKNGDNYYGLLPEGSNSGSITSYGVCEKPEYYKCDFINDLTTAQSIQTFYLAHLAGGVSKVQVTAPLADFGIEANDFITITDADSQIALSTSTKLMVDDEPLIIPPKVIEKNGRKSIMMITINSRGY